MLHEITFLQIDPANLEIPLETSVNPQIGGASTSIGIPITSGRNGFQPALNLIYSSGAGNSVFGMGWNLQGIPTIVLSLKDGYPKYDGTDKFSFGGQELIPWLVLDEGEWIPRTDENTGFFISYYRTTVDPSFIRLEKWVDKSTRSIHWRVHNRKNQVMVFGKNPDNSTKIYDPENPRKFFQWLLEAQYDNMGNAIEYEYISDDLTNVNSNSSFERTRFPGSGGNAQKYLKRIRYGNTIPLLPNNTPDSSQNWLFEVVMDYGDQEETEQPLYTSNPSIWPVREDPFSAYIAGFEQRTYRLCKGILMFHNIDELGADPTLVGRLGLVHQPNSAGSTLNEVSYTGYKRTSVDSYDSKDMPPVVFNYTSPDVENYFHNAPEQSKTNVPVGLNGLNYKWVDLYGEGLPGVLYESFDAWYYKPNLGDGNLGQQHKVMEKPNSATGSYALSDFDGDGNLNLMVLQGRESGFFEYNRDSGIWDGFKPFKTAPHIRQMDINTQLIDLTGDGRSDILTTEQDRIIWYPSKGKEGFGEAVQIAKPISNGVSRAPTIGANPMLDYFYADMNGSGLPDQVHVFNGKVEYWPNMGNGNFGASVIMDNAPQLDFDFELDASKIRLVDLDGSGTSDLIYIGRGEIKYWINASGNRFIEGETLRGLPFIDNLSSAQVIDFLGDGTPCLVWSSSLQMHMDAPIHYLRLTSGIKPRLMASVQNSMGLETQFHYGYSGQHYLRDKESNSPWITKLPSHQTLVDRLETIDHIGNTRFNQLYEYHDGYFDGEERAFRGFSLVDQYDSEVYQGTSGIPEAQFTDPVCVRTWYHNGAPGWQKARVKQYYSYDSYSPQLKDFYIENELGAEEFYDAIRSLAGQVIRSETYGLTIEGTRKTHPFQVAHNNYFIRRTQPKEDDFDAGFVAFQSESIEINFEENPDDPRITHSLSLETDEYGVPTTQVAIAYPRTAPDALPEQQDFHVNLTKIQVIHVDEIDRYEVGIELQKQGFELQDPANPSTGILYNEEAIKNLADAVLESPLAFNEPFTTGTQARVLQWTKTFYWDDDQTAVLAWGEVGNKILPHHQEVACFNSEFLENALGSRFTPSLIAEGGYISHDELWWQPGTILHYNADTGFYLLSREVQTNGAFVEYRYDGYHIALLETTAVLTDSSRTELARNTTSAEIDYNVLAPVQITDANHNISEVRYDPLGVVVLASMQGEILSASGTLELHGHSRLSEYIDPSEIDFNRILNEPSQYLQECASFFYYELDTWQRERLPVRNIAVGREQWVHDGAGNYQPDSTYQLSVEYLDGLARVLQSKTLVEPGSDTIQYSDGNVVLGSGGEPELVTSTVLRWLVSGHAVYNNKQQAVQQYEPYFSPLVDFESDEVLETFGVSGQVLYDAVGRQKEMHLADGTINRVVIYPWHTEQYDANDAILGSPYERINSPLLVPDSPEGLALQKSIAHNDTPVISHTDNLGRVFLVEERDENERLRSNRTVFDALGNPKEIIDARGLTAFTYFRDMLGRVFHEQSMDAGAKWQFLNALDQPVHLWDGRDVHQQITYNSWGRMVEKYVDGALEMNHITERFIYGEDPSIADAWQRNLLGQLVENYDQAGLTRYRHFDLLGNLLEKNRRVLQDYTSIPNWSSTTGHTWMADDPFETRITYDALGRPILQRLPDQTTRRTTYLQSGVIDQLLLTTGDGEMVEQPIIKANTYNAKGQQKELIFGNDVIQQFEYDPYNFRLKRKNSFRRVTPTLAAMQYQSINYTYDAVGNMTHLVDSAQPTSTILFDQPRINQYTYDAFYQLTVAQGRTHEAMERTDYAHAPDAPGFIKGTRHVTIDNMALIRTYTRRYTYDLNGNMQNLIHNSGTTPSDVLRWRRDFWISENSNRSIEQNDLSGNPVSNPQARFDENGNLTYMSHLRNVEWNYLNQLTSAVIIERTSDLNDAEYYVYGSDGQRVRKVTQALNNGSLETIEKIYLDGCEIKRITQGDTLLLESYSSHLSDDNGRVALLHQWTKDTRSRETDDITQKRIHYQLSCHLGSSAFELDEEGEIINYEEYFAFGGSAFVFGNSLRDINLKEYRYSGKERDDATQLYYYGFRYYAPWLCRWLNPDPIGPEDGLNLYLFVHNNPINEVDPDGLQTSASHLIDDGFTYKGAHDVETNSIQVIYYLNGQRGEFTASNDNSSLQDLIGTINESAFFGHSEFGVDIQDVLGRLFYDDIWIENQQRGSSIAERSSHPSTNNEPSDEQLLTGAYDTDVDVIAELTSSQPLEGTDEWWEEQIRAACSQSDNPEACAGFGNVQEVEFTDSEARITEVATFVLPTAIILEDGRIKSGAGRVQFLPDLEGNPDFPSDFTRERARTAYLEATDEALESISRANTVVEGVIPLFNTYRERIRNYNQMLEDYGEAYGQGNIEAADQIFNDYFFREIPIIGSIYNRHTNVQRAIEAEERGDMKLAIHLMRNDNDPLYSLWHSVNSLWNSANSDDPIQRGQAQGGALNMGYGAAGAMAASPFSFEDLIDDIDEFDNNPTVIDRLSRAQEFDVGGYRDLTASGRFGRTFDGLDSDEALQNLFLREGLNISRTSSEIRFNPAVALTPEIHRMIRNLKKPDIPGMSAVQVLNHHLTQMRSSGRIPHEVLIVIEREAMRFINDMGL